MYDEYMFSEQPYDFVHMTIKNYGAPNGMSDHLFTIAEKSKVAKTISHDPVAMITTVSQRRKSGNLLRKSFTR